ncbi:hypothetical protein RUM43_006331 [Polyplax serrata]|uniref:H15 domain-containing protein n=1 Tax=Polyplax serrata TaxID=468196 RepID=A0AAN8NRU8_POLSC
MSNRKRKHSPCDDDSEEETINELLPDILVASENFKSATPEKIRRCLQETYNIKATRSQIQIALDNGCRLGLIQERKRYCLNPTFSMSAIQNKKKGACDPCAD